MKKTQSTSSSRSQDKTGNRSNQKTNSDRNKKSEPNKSSANKDKPKSHLNANGFKQSEAVSNHLKTKQGVKNNAQMDEDDEDRNDVNDRDEEDDEEGDMIYDKKSSGKTVDLKQK